MFETLLSVFEKALSLWDHKEKNKYQDRLIELRREYYNEINKPEYARSDATLTHLEFELRNLAGGWASLARQPNTAS